jgi:hypothetical protein
MRKHSKLALALTGALIAAIAVAGIAGATGFTTRAGNLILKGDGKITPKALSKTKFTPIKAAVSGSLKTVDGSQPPITKEVNVEVDKNIQLNTKGLAVCSSGQLEAQDTKHAEKACPDSIVGKGITDVRVEFPESAPFSAHGPLVLFNGGSGMLLVHAYVNVPLPTALVTKVAISKIHNGRLGTKYLAKIPVIAGGSGAVTNFSLTVSRTYNYKGKSQGYLTAKCPDGHFTNQAQAKFNDGTSLKGTVVLPCTSKG